MLKNIAAFIVFVKESELVKMSNYMLDFGEKNYYNAIRARCIMLYFRKEIVRRDHE